MNNLSEILTSLIRKHSSPTIGRGGVHGGQTGYIIYENELKFIVAGLQKETEAVSHAQDAAGSLPSVPDHGPRTALHPYGQLLKQVTPGVTWEDHLAAEARDAKAD